MIAVSYIDVDRGRIIFQVGTKTTFYFKTDSWKLKGMLNRAAVTLALVKAMKEAVSMGVITAWS